MLGFVHMMALYNKNSKISIDIIGDGSEIFDFGLPYPHSYSRTSLDRYSITFNINGHFHTKAGIAFLNDVTARFTLSMQVLDLKVTSTQESGIELSAFQGLRSVINAKDYEKGHSGRDEVFWAIKMHVEELIRESGFMVAYSLVESFAFSRFRDVAKDNSTLRAKCRSIWNWYYNRDWTIPERETSGRNRSEQAKYATDTLVEAKKSQVVEAVRVLKFFGTAKINVSTVAKEAKVTRKTASKYLQELGII